MLPRVVRRVVRRWVYAEASAISGPETEASWQRLMARVHRPRRDIEQRMADIERELNRLGLD